ncbi:hypothetical protein JCM10449v2_005584 [Rhodotorula kratochvilovae]
MRFLSLVSLATGALSLFSPALAATSTRSHRALAKRADTFGVTRSNGDIVVSTEAGLSFTVDIDTGDVNSILYAGKELQDQGSKARLKSHLVSGLGTGATVEYKLSGDVVLVTVKATSLGPTMRHYYIARKGYNHIYMATYSDGEPTIGELRYIFRLNRAVLSSGYRASDVKDCGSAIEGQDVFLCSGETRSKFYSSRQFIDDYLHGVTGSGVGAWMVISPNGYEKSSGGPFFRDIDNQGSAQQELYFYMNSGHMKTEAYRTGLFGPYALVVNSGSAPSASSVDFSFMDALGLTGAVAPSARGAVSGKVSGANGNEYLVVGFSNTNAQYWVRPRAKDGRFTLTDVIPGTYTATLYNVELGVATASVSISAGKTADLGLTFPTETISPIWQLGTPDGTPRGFLNADKIETMHPSDARMSSWTPSNNIFRITSATPDASTFPMAQFADVNSGIQIVFTLTSDQVKSARTLEIGVTSSFAGGRPQASRPRLRVGRRQLTPDPAGDRQQLLGQGARRADED